MSNLTKNFFRNDLNLNKRWWHRLLKITFFTFIVFLILWSYGDYNLIGYSKISNLSSYITKEHKTVQEIIDETKIENVLISSSTTEPTNGKDMSWAISRDSICSKDLTFTIYYFNSKKYEFYTGKMFSRTKVDPETFLNYLDKQNIECIIPTFYTGYDGGDIPMVQTYEEDRDSSLKDLYLYKPNKIKTTWYLLFGTYFSKSQYLYPGIWFFTVIPAIILIFIYYKLVLYIIFGPKKKN